MQFNEIQERWGLLRKAGLSGVDDAVLARSTLGFGPLRMRFWFNKGFAHSPNMLLATEVVARSMAPGDDGGDAEAADHPERDGKE